MPLLEFLALAALIAVSGSRLSKYGDVIAEKTGLGGAWTGVVLMASITSLPEMTAGVSSALGGLADIAVGNIMGACLFNLLIMALLDPLDRTSPLFSKVGRSHVISGGFSVVLVSILTVSIHLGPEMPEIAHVGAYAPMIAIFYLAGIRAVYRYERRSLSVMAGQAAEKLKYTGIPLKRAAVLYALNALVVVACAIFLPDVAEEIAVSTGLSEGFVGTVFVSLATTLPELTVSLASVRIGAYDLATGNLLGSNMFNVALIAVDDVFYTEGPILAAVSAAHAVTGAAITAMTALALIGITYRAEKKVILRFGWDSLAMAALGILNIVYLYTARGGR